MIKPRISIPPSIRDISPSNKNKIKKVADPNMKCKSMKMYSLPNCKLRLETIVATPRIKNILEILAPSTFPITISEWPWAEAMMPDISSGKEVPIATITTPTIKGESFIDRPILSAASVKILGSSD